jgi:hypothetical protein
MASPPELCMWTPRGPGSYPECSCMPRTSDVRTCAFPRTRRGCSDCGHSLALQAHVRWWEMRVAGDRRARRGCVYVVAGTWAWKVCLGPGFGVSVGFALLTPRCMGLAGGSSSPPTSQVGPVPLAWQQNFYTHPLLNMAPWSVTNTMLTARHLPPWHPQPLPAPVRNDLPARPTCQEGVAMPTPVTSGGHSEREQGAPQVSKRRNGADDDIERLELRIRHCVEEALNKLDGPTTTTATDLRARSRLCRLVASRLILEPDIFTSDVHLAALRLVANIFGPAAARQSQRPYRASKKKSRCGSFGELKRMWEWGRAAHKYTAMTEDRPTAHGVYVDSAGSLWAEEADEEDTSNTEGCVVACCCNSPLPILTPIINPLTLPIRDEVMRCRSWQHVPCRL